MTPEVILVKGKSLTILHGVEVCQMSEILLMLFADFGAKGHRLFRVETTDGQEKIVYIVP